MHLQFIQHDYLKLHKCKRIFKTQELVGKHQL